ncbi:carbohydrate ABC transporter permease [Streptomyces sp. NPDC059740]|uniref:carbohydrate ABC transporter permease n=1 Tax=Streptomyces sp. NPDC059740 TaxID=3346926 RepID=UPI00364BFA9A
MTTSTPLPAAAPAPPDAGAPSPARPRRDRTGPRDRRLACTALMAPFFTLLVAVFLVPVATAVYLSFFADDQPGLGFGPERTVFVGLRAYSAVLTDPTFLAGLGTIGLYCVLYVPVLVVLSLGLALLLDSGMVRLRRTAQLLLFLPHAVPTIIAALIWLYLYTPGLSPVVGLLARGDLHIDFLGVHTVLPSIVNIAVWSNLGYEVVVFYAALQAVPREVLEAAVVDGAGPVRTALRIKTPLIRASVVMVAMFSLIGALQLFTEPTLLNQTAPLVGTRYTPNMYIYDAAFTRNNYGLAAAASVVLLAVTVLASYGVTRWTSRAGRLQEGAA